MTSRSALVNTVSAHMVAPEWAARVVSPLHDVLTVDERRAILAENPDSYLHVTSDPLALPEPPGDDAAESAQGRALRRLLDLGAYAPLPEPALFVYRMSDRGREHTGVIASVSVAGFGDGRVLGHEDVHPERVDALVRHYQQVPMRSELVALIHPPDPVVSQLTARVVAQSPVLSFTDAGGSTQSVWRARAEDAAHLTRRLSEHTLYVADGHHRVAAATRCWELQGRPRSGAVLCALYPQDRVLLHAFHRRVRGPVAAKVLLASVAEHFDVAPGAGPGVAAGTIGLYAEGRWSVLRPRTTRAQPGVAGLDVTMLEEHLLLPVLGVTVEDPRLEYVADVGDLGAATRQCDDDGGILFTLHPPGVEDLVAVAERHERMSPKTTYVEPKPHTGIFLS